MSLQFVRKLSGFNSPSKANSAAFDRAGVREGLHRIAALYHIEDEIRDGKCLRRRPTALGFARLSA